MTRLPERSLQLSAVLHYERNVVCLVLIVVPVRRRIFLNFAIFDEILHQLLHYIYLSVCESFLCQILKVIRQRILSLHIFLQILFLLIFYGEIYSKNSFQNLTESLVSFSRINLGNSLLREVLQNNSSVKF